MSINSVIAAYGSGVSNVYSRTEKGRNGVGTEKPAAPKKSEQVEISSASRDMRTVRNAIDSLPEVRIPIVTEIKRLIDQNDYPYETNLDGLADKMLSSGVFA